MRSDVHELARFPQVLVFIHSSTSLSLLSSLTLIIYVGLIILVVAEKSLGARDAGIDVATTLSPTGTNAGLMHHADYSF